MTVSNLPVVDVSTDAAIKQRFLLRKSARFVVYKLRAKAKYRALGISVHQWFLKTTAAAQAAPNTRIRQRRRCRQSYVGLRTF